MNRNHAIRIIGGIGCGFTSVKRATKFISQRRAIYIDEQTIAMIATDHRHCSALRTLEESTARLQSQPTPFAVYAYHGSENLRTFAPYPDPEPRKRRCGRPMIFGLRLAKALASSSLDSEVLQDAIPDEIVGDIWILHR